MTECAHSVDPVDSADPCKDDCKDELCTITPNSSLTSLSTLGGSPCASPPLTLLLGAPPRLAGIADQDGRERGDQEDQEGQETLEDGVHALMLDDIGHLDHLQQLERFEGDTFTCDASASEWDAASRSTDQFLPPLRRRWSVQIPILRAHPRVAPTPLIRSSTI